MESRTTPVRKAKRKSPLATATKPQQPLKAENAQITASQRIEEEAKGVINELKELYKETVKLDVDLQHDIYNAEKSYEPKHLKIFDKRFKLLDDFKMKFKTGDGDVKNNKLATFWLNVLKSSYPDFVSKCDEEILTHLTDMRSKLQVEPNVKFTLIFTFEPNEFFTNRNLTKSYYLNCSPDPENPIIYDGAEIYKCEGCQIDWKPKYKTREGEESFFDFFDPPELPPDGRCAGYSEINAALQNDFELGFYLKERVIPKAILFYTGEIPDCLSSDSETEDEDDDDDVEVEEDAYDSANEDKHIKGN